MNLILKKIIREQLEKVLNTLDEQEVQSMVSVPSHDSREDLICDYSEGGAFAENTLKADIMALKQYSLYDYFPVIEQSETWKFEYETVKDILLVVEIKHAVNNDRSFWSITFGTLQRTPPGGNDREPKELNVISEIENIEGYENFINTVNRTLTNKMDPSKF